ncbi:MAG: PAS domain S-box protein [Bacteroidetes bacterium]|nr:MAG: PAS domain S-box protein [Bacteroidota bacterium]
MKKGNYRENILHNAPFGYAYHRIILDDKGHPVDFQYIEVNSSFEKMTGLKAKDILGKKAGDIIPRLKHESFDWFALYGKIALEGGEENIIKYLETFDRWYKIHVCSPEKHYFSTIFYDITSEVIANEKLKKTEQQLRDQLEEDKVMNEELTVANEELININHELQTMTQALGKTNDHFNALINSIPDMIFVFDREGVFLDCRAASAEELILAPEEFLHKKDKEVLPPFLYQLNQKALTDLFDTGQPQTYSYTLEVKGKKRYFDARMVKMGTDKALSIVRDITHQKITEEKLRESEITFRALFEKGPIGVAYHKMIYDDRGKPVDYLFLDANESYEKLTGVNPKDMLVTEAFPGIKKDPFNWIETFGKVARDGKEIRFQQYLQPNNRWYDCVAYQYKPDHFVAAFLEITEQKLAEEALRKSENKFRLIFEKSPMGILQFNQQGIVTECNDYLCTIIKSPRERIIGVDLRKISNIDLQQALEEVLAGNPATYTGEFQTIVTKISTPVRLLASPVLSDGNIVEGGICLVEDRSDHLEKEKYEQQIAIARESVRFKQNFLANMSHEIRTPLTGIMGVIDILSESELSTERKEHMEILKNTSENLMEIVNQVLDFSKIEDGKVRLKRIDFNFHEFLQQSVRFYQKLCNGDVSMSLTIHPEVPEWLNADKSRLSQILNNLLSNAIKFTDEGTIHLEVSKVEQEKVQTEASPQEHCIKVAVTDSGIGIEPEKLTGLFKPFAQVDDRDIRRYEGTGLGLSISKQLAALHGGDTGAVSTPDEGSTFWFTFRAGKVTQQTASKDNPTPEKPSPPKTFRILLAEDKTINQKVITILLKHMGHQVTIACDGQQVVQIYKSGAFDLILMDIQMPVMDGVAATHALRSMYDDLPPVVGLSANAFEGDREKYMALGMDDYLTKPLRKDAFLEMLTRVFGD